MKKIMLVMFLMLASMLVPLSLVAATGQPSQSCGSANAYIMPNGFNTAGFANAGTVYAGSGVSTIHANSANAVSQYDVACYQLTQHQ